jgi:hypothetical protein
MKFEVCSEKTSSPGFLHLSLLSVLALLVSKLVSQTAHHLCHCEKFWVFVTPTLLEEGPKLEPYCK